MPFIAKEAVAEKRKAIRAALPGFKVSVRLHNHSGVDVTVMAGPLPLPERGRIGEGHCTVNRFYLDRWEDCPEWKQVLETINEIATAGMGRGFQDSDYGYVPGHYVDIQIGRWDSPYRQWRERARRA